MWVDVSRTSSSKFASDRGGYGGMWVDTVQSCMGRYGQIWGDTGRYHSRKEQ